MAQQKSEQELEENQLRKMRRRIEEFLRHTTPERLVQIAVKCHIKIPEKLKEKYFKNK